MNAECSERGIDAAGFPAHIRGTIKWHCIPISRHRLMPANEPKPGGEIVLYQTEDGRTPIECRFEKENVWMTQALMAELFQTTPQNITLHLKAIYEEGELAEAATCKDYLQVRAEGARRVQRALRHYNLEAILAVGATRLRREIVPQKVPFPHRMGRRWPQAG
jgi:hypothetical protein